MTACFTSAFSVNHLPSTYPLRGPSLDGNHCVPYWQPKLCLVTVIRLWRLWTTHSTVPMSCVHLFGPPEKHLPGTRFATDADVKQGVAFWSVTWYRFILHRYRALIARWDRYIVVGGDWTHWWGNLRERDHWGDPDVDGRIILTL
jgi:hypothetical protein